MTSPPVPASQQDKWNRIYRNRAHQPEPQPCTLLSQYQYLLPTKGNALDIACGTGGNAIFLANHGFTTNAWDISDVAVNQLNGRKIARLQASVVDVEEQPMAKNSFDVIVVSCFLHRPLCPAIIEALTPGGLLFYQTFHQQKVSSSGPSNPEFLLKNNELLELFNGLNPLIYQQLSNQGDLELGDRNLASLIAQKPY